MCPKSVYCSPKGPKIPSVTGNNVNDSSYLNEIRKEDISSKKIQRDICSLSNNIFGTGD